MQRYLQEETLRAVQGLKPIAEAAGLSMPQMAIAWVLQNENVTSAIVGASRPEQLTESVKASGVKLDADTLQAIDAVLAGVVFDDPELTETLAFRKRLV
jgi:aryl-alcohol dehydrogenase-like predicted oxidoreductase